MTTSEYLLDKAKREGIEEGREEGIAKSRLEFAVKMLENGSNVEFVANITGLTNHEIQNLIK